MALGVSSYSQGGPRRRLRRPPRTRGRRPPWQELIEGLGPAAEAAWPWLRLPLSLLALAHVALLVLFPGGVNGLLGVAAEETPAYLSLFRAPDTLGIYAADGVNAFIVYKIYTEGGEVVEGIFPDPDVAPKLRYDRWAAAADAATGPFANLHTFVTGYVLKQLSSPPVRMELYAAKWRWDRNTLHFPWPGPRLQTRLELRLLGNYNGLTRTWEPPAPPPTRKERSRR